jgi:hypothetical protein
MSCPRCKSDDLWDDNLWWGCNHCGYAANETGGTMAFAKDIPGLPRTVKEVDECAGLTPLDYLPRLIPNRPEEPEE